tara:strand:+ start:1633 stop:2607 length:975 start_codon:yes stop_codon:yes gene_type:complete
MEAAERLKISAENLNSMLTTSLQKISDTRKRTKKLKAVSILRKKRKKKEAKIEIPSVFKKSTDRIKSKVMGGTGNLFNNILGFVSLILLGTAITNIETIQEKIKEARESLSERLRPVMNIAEKVFEIAGLFVDDYAKQEQRQKEQDKLVKDIEKMKKIQKDFENVSFQYGSLGRTYKDIESGDYAEGQGFKLQKKGTLSTGEKFKFNQKKNEFVVTSLDGTRTTYSYEDFLERYGATDMTTIITPEGYKPGDVMSQQDFDKLYNRNINFDESASINNNNDSLLAFSGMNNSNDFLMDFDEELFNRNLMKETTYLQTIYLNKETA